MTRITVRHWFALAVTLALAASAAGSATAGGTADARAARKEIKAQLGFVPGFLAHMPDSVLPTAWQAMGALEFNPDTALSAKLKETLVVAVASQIPCHYCIYAGTALARQAGATDVELAEGVAMAGITRHWSTVLNGVDYSFTRFKREIDAAFAFAGSGKKGHHPARIRTAADAYQDIEATFGAVPGFFRAVPEAAIVALWPQMKAVQFSTDTQLAPKDKELIGLAVASQIPCRYCVYSHTKAAKAFGATDQEVREAIAMAASVRFWSTYLNGTQVDKAEFKRDVDRLARPKTAARR